MVHASSVQEENRLLVKKAKVWLRKAMIDGMNGALKDPCAEGPRVPVEVGTQVAKTWAG